MSIDFDNLPVLPSPARVQRRKDRAFRERQQINLLSSKGRKKHSVNRERSREDAARARARKLKLAKTLSSVATYKRAVRAYWLGERDDHPIL